MKDFINHYIEEHKNEIISLGKLMYRNPQLGYKETINKEIILEFLNSHGLHRIQEFAVTGLSVTIGSGKPHIGLIAELDAIPVCGHPDANEADNAAHACGHSTQCAIMLSVIDALNQRIDELNGTVTLFFTPAEEYTDIPYRESLIQQGVIQYIGGKQNMIAQHLFDNIDCLIHLHGTGVYKGYQYSVNPTLAGFIYKKITFNGVAAHAAMCPQFGANALNMCNLFLNAMNMLRETFVEEDMVRVHGIIDKGGDTVNSIPGEVIYECYVRSLNPETMIQVSNKLNQAATHCAQALNGSCTIEDKPGYLPLLQSKELNDVIYDNILPFATKDQIRTDEKSVAAGDVGDISMLKPIIQYGYTGFEGRFHGTDFQIADEEKIYVTQPKVVAGSVIDLLSNPSLVNHIVSNFKPSMSFDEYLDYLNKGK